MSVTRSLSFPEGRGASDGTVARFKGGPFVLALEAHVPIVPVSIAGSRYVMKKGRLMVCPGEVSVTVHEPIETSGVSRSAVRELVDRVRKNVRTSVDEPASADSSA